MKFFRAVRRFLTRRRGTAAIEFSLVIVPLMLLMFGVIEVARLVWVQNAIHEIAISGARCMGIAALDCADGDDTNAAKTQEYIRTLARSWGISIELSEIELDVNSGCGETAGFSSVVIDHKFISVLTLLTNADLRFEGCFPNQN